MQSTAIIHRCRPFTAHALLSQPSPENNNNNNNNTNQALQFTGVTCVLKNRKHQDYRKYLIRFIFSEPLTCPAYPTLACFSKEVASLGLKVSKQLWSDFGSCEVILCNFYPLQLQRVWAPETPTLVRLLCPGRPGQPGGHGLPAQPPVEAVKD